MRAYKCDRCGEMYQPNRHFPKYKLKCYKTRMKICRRCYASLLYYTVSGEIEKQESRKAWRDFFISAGFGEENSDFALPADVTDLKYSFLEKIK